MSVLACLVAACGSSTQTAVPPAAPRDDAIPAQFDMTYRWESGPVLQVAGAEGTFVRAFVESFELANAGESLRWEYPGFAAAAPSNISQMISVYAPEVSTAEPGVGTTFYTALRRVDDGDWTRIVLCRYGYQSVRDPGRNTWRSAIMPARPVEIDFVRTGTTPTTRSGGPDRTPGDDVFGGWYVTRFDFMAIYPTPTADQHACSASRPDALPQRAPVDQSRPWPSLSPSPGWPPTATDV